MKIIIVTIYLSCNHKDNNKIYEEIEKIINTYEEQPVLLIGDMNAHTNIIVKDKINKNGEK